MKISKYLTILIVLAGLAGCDLFTQPEIARFEVTEMESPDQSQWSSADYIATTESGLEVTSMSDLKKLLDSIHSSESAELEAAWFREGTPMCNQLTVVVPTQLFIDISGDLPVDETGGVFESFEGEPNLFCPSDVLKLTPVSKQERSDQGQ